MAALASVNLAEPREFRFRGQRVPTGIFKVPTTAEVEAGPQGLRGDLQADPRYHGGPHKAVYAYSAEHYPFWRQAYPALEMPYGMFGENLTVTGISEPDLWIGDEYRAGTAVLRVVQPRTPCFKLGLKFGHTRVIRQFLESGRSGFYLAVAEPGRFRVGQELTRVRRGPQAVTVADLAAMARKSLPRERLEAVAACPAVLPEWRERALALLAEPE